jgi:hypothetical protein
MHTALLAGLLKACGHRKREGVQDRESFGIIATPQFMPEREIYDPVFDLLRACSIKA